MSRYSYKTIFFHFFLLFSSVAGLVFGTARVTSLSVNRIGLGGGMITINGEGFATDAFSQFDPSKGNKVRGCFMFQIKIMIDSI